MAVDRGVLVNVDVDVLVSVRNVIGGTDLAEIHKEVKRQFLNLNEQEKTFARC